MCCIQQNVWVMRQLAALWLTRWACESLRTIDISCSTLITGPGSIAGLLCVVLVNTWSTSQSTTAILYEYGFNELGGHFSTVCVNYEATWRLTRVRKTLEVLCWLVEISKSQLINQSAPRFPLCVLTRNLTLSRFSLGTLLLYFFTTHTCHVAGSCHYY